MADFGLIYATIDIASESVEEIKKQQRLISKFTIWAIQKKFAIYAPVIYSPHLANASFIEFERWLDINLRILRTCDYMLVFSSDSHKFSSIVEKEIAVAKEYYIPIAYTSTADEAIEFLLAGREKYGNEK